MEGNEQQDIAVCNGDFGKRLIEMATTQRQKRNAEQVVGIVDSQMEQVEMAKRRVVLYQKVQQQAENRLKAIEAGEFTIEQGNFVYNDPELADVIAIGNLDLWKVSSPR